MQFASRRAVLWFAVAVVAALPAQAADGPAAALIEKASTEVIALIKAKTGRAREEGIRSILVTYFDLPFMGQSALGTHWAATSPPQRERFLKAVVSAEIGTFNICGGGEHAIFAPHIVDTNQREGQGQRPKALIIGKAIPKTPGSFAKSVVHA